MTTDSWLLRGARIVPCDPDREDSRIADVRVDAGIITAIGADLPSDGRPVLELEGKLLMPGMIDTHRHAWQTPLRALGADWTAIDYLAAVRVKLAPVFAPDDVYAGNLAGALEAIDAGITTLVDHSHIVATPEHADAAIQALEDAGIRALYAYGFAPPSEDGGSFESHQARLEDARRLRRTRFSANDGLVRMGIALTEMQIPWEQSRAEILTARELDLPMTLHCSAWPTTVRTEPDRMAEEDLIGPDMLFVHCTFSSDEDLARIATGGASIAATPESELQMGMGFPVTGRALAAGARVTLGCDVVTSNGGDLFTAMRLALQVERGRTNALVGMPRAVSLRARQMLPMVTRDAAEAIGLGRTVGQIAVGREADLVVLSADEMNLTPMQHATDAIVMQAHAGNVESVMVRGRLLKHHGKLLGDVSVARARLCAAREAVLARVGGIDGLWTDLPSALAKWDIGRVDRAQPGSAE